MTVKKEKPEHHLTKAKRLREEEKAKEIAGAVEWIKEVLSETPVVPVEKAEPKAKKTSWTVVWNERGVDREFTYYIETPEAEVNAAKLALKKGGKVI